MTVVGGGGKLRVGEVGRQERRHVHYHCDIWMTHTHTHMSCLCFVCVLNSSIHDQMKVEAVGCYVSVWLLCLIAPTAWYSITQSEPIKATSLNTLHIFSKEQVERDFSVSLWIAVSCRWKLFPGQCWVCWVADIITVVAYQIFHNFLLMVGRLLASITLWRSNGWRLNKSAREKAKETAWTEWGYVFKSQILILHIIILILWVHESSQKSPNF